MILSIIIPVYNGESHIGNLFNSLTENNFLNNNDVEVVVVNDGSYDNTDSIVAEYNDRFNSVKYIKLDKNYGLSKARNVGFSKSTGDYILYFDCDDLITMTFDKIKTDIRNNISFDIIIYDEMRKTNTLKNSVDSHHTIVGEYINYNPDELMLGEPYIRECVHDKIIKREYCKKFDEDLYYYSEDVDFLYNVLLETPSIKVIKGCMHNYIRNKDSKSVWTKTHLWIKELDYINNKYDDNAWIQTRIEYTTRCFLNDLTMEERMIYLGFNKEDINEICN